MVFKAMKLEWDHQESMLLEKWKGERIKPYDSLVLGGQEDGAGPRDRSENPKKEKNQTSVVSW